MDKIALVTGSSRGIGRAVARRLAAEGYAVCVNYRVRQDCAMSLVSEITAAGGSDLRHQRHGAVLPHPVVDAHGVALGGQTARHSAADAPGGACHQRDLVHGIIPFSQFLPLSIANFRRKGKKSVDKSEAMG